MRDGLVTVSTTLVLSALSRSRDCDINELSPTLGMTAAFVIGFVLTLDMPLSEYEYC